MRRWLAFGYLLGLAACAPKPGAPVMTPAPQIRPAPPAPKARAVHRSHRHHQVVRAPLPEPRPAIPPSSAAQPSTKPPAVTQEAPKAPPPRRQTAHPREIAHGPAVPPGARRYAPILVAKQAAIWPKAPEPWTLGGLVEQESCVSLKSRRCWNPRAELKTHREYGFGFGQITIAYNSDGSVRFDKFAELRREYRSLHAWRWDDRYDPGYQLVAVVEMVRGLWMRMPPAADGTAHWAFTLSSYNGGRGALLRDRLYCKKSRNCDPDKWFGNIETHSLKSKAPWPAYGGRSPYQINRGYVHNVLDLRRAKYQQFWD